MKSWFLLRFYRFLWRFLPKIIPFYLKKRGKKNPAYIQNWGERFGEVHPNPVKNAIWIHAVSVGETHAAVPIVRHLQQHFPDAPLLITQMTPTGRDTAQKLFPNAQCRYLPYDNPQFVAQFLREHQPRFGVLMETEIWVNLLHACRQQNVPIFLANARLSDRSLQGYLRVQSLISPALATLSACFAQTQADAQRLQQLGVPETIVCGNSKYDVVPTMSSADAEIIDFPEILGERKIALCASTRFYDDVDEAELLLQAWQNYHGDALLLIVPRHPERFDAVYQMAKKMGFITQKRSDLQPIAANTQVLVGDSMGEMTMYYQLADMAFIGGSLVDSGCQNPIEAAAAGKAMMFGFSTYNFAQVCQDALNAQAAVQVQTANEWREQVEQWLHNPDICQQIGENARKFVAQHRGASQKMADLIAAKVKPKQLL
ncbi:MAG: lipid IV(A) 3-deoxy-D-manno-octulosonic acid transferase [Neisseria sp.]|nr:lipid IV(A) 3-deoxy-D-manno-octulosonic acid transferase [Neisseria sp.]